MFCGYSHCLFEFLRNRGMCHPERIIYLEKLGIRKAHECWIREYAQKVDLVKIIDIKIPKKENVDKSSANKVRAREIIDAPSKEPHRRGTESIFDNEYPAFSPPREV